MAFLEENNNGKIILEKGFWLNIYNLLVFFDHFIIKLIEQVINLTYEINEFTEKDYVEKIGVSEKFDQIVDYFTNIKNIVKECLKICKVNKKFNADTTNQDNITLKSLNDDKTNLIESTLENSNGDTADFDFNNAEIKRVFNVILEIYGNKTLLKDISNIKMATIKDVQVHCQKVMKFSKQHLKLIVTIEKFINNLSLSENQSLECRKFFFIRSKSYLYECLKCLKKYTTYPPNYTLTEDDFTSFLKGYNLEMIIEDCDTVIDLFNELIEKSEKDFSGEPCLIEKFAVFKREVLSYKESVIEYDNSIEFTIIGRNFLKNVLNLIMLSNYTYAMAKSLEKN